MNILILQGSPNKNGHTKQFSDCMIDELRRRGASVTEEWIYDKDIKPCLGCGVCQDRIGELGCVHEDDFAALVEQVRASDLTVFSTPIYDAFAPGPVKTFMDRLIYAPVKAYGKEKAPSMLAGGRCAILITSGFDPKRMVVPFETSVAVLAKKLDMEYLGWTGATDPGKSYVFMSEKKAERARAFAAELMEKLTSGE